MAKGLLMSILFAAVAIPACAARAPRPASGARSTVIGFAVYVVIWAYALLHLYPQLEK